MTVSLEQLVRDLDPQRTILFLGAGSSASCGAPTGNDLARHLADAFSLPSEGFSLRELASLVEERHTRQELINSVRKRLKGLRVTGGLLNLPLYDWKSLYTTNYDDLIEQSYGRQGVELTVYSSDFDFTIHETPGAMKLFKLHGSLEKDIVDGHVTRLILTETDYDHTEDYRNSLYDRLKADMAGAHLIVIGHSLEDQEIKQIVNRALELARGAPATWRISVLLHVRDDNRALLMEKRGVSVGFGGVDEFFSAVAQRFPPGPPTTTFSTDPLDAVPVLRPITVDVAHESALESDVSAMFNGWPASHADILAGLTFERSVARRIEEAIETEKMLCAVLLGASGVGKTTAARQVLQRLRSQGEFCWEHQVDQTLPVRAWVDVALRLQKQEQRGVLLVDEAHGHLNEINSLVDQLVGQDVVSLRLLFVSTRNHWNPRVKTPNIFRVGREYVLSRLSTEEIERLLNLVDKSEPIRELVEQTFSGFSRHERRRRLVDRCASEMFVCLKNIFASEKFDDIILREYATLDPDNQEIYRHVAALENAGVRVHRQLVIRLLGIPAEEVGAVLVGLTDIVSEYTISEKEGVYGWRGRHPVIVSIVSRYKYPDVEKRAELFAKVIDSISPTYEIEIRTIRELCNIESGLPSIPDKKVQNTLLRKMMSVAPGERVPRHRLIRNLIKTGEFEKADTEIRIFEKDFGADGPVARYKVSLLIARATTTPGIMEEDRLAILEQARSLAAESIERFPYSKSLYCVYCDVGLEQMRRTGDSTVFDEALAALKTAEERIGDPDISRLIAEYESSRSRQTADAAIQGLAEEEDL